MKAYKDRFPTIVVGGKAGDFLGEYMAGGVIVVLNRNDEEKPVGNFTATGIHGGSMFVRGKVAEELLGIGAETNVPSEEDKKSEYASHFQIDLDYDESEFIKIHSRSHRPYGRLYVLE